MDDPKATSLCAVHTVPGVIPHWTRPGQTVVWNMTGQVAFAEGNSITILTPFTPPPAAVAKIVNKSRPPPPATAIVVHEETEEAPTIPPEFDRIPCWKGRFAVETRREPSLNAEVTQLLFELDEANMLFGPKDPGVKALAWSPKGLAPLGGCMLAVLETNLNLTIRSTDKDYIQGAWIDTCNLTHETYKLSAPSSETLESEKSTVPGSNLHRARELLFQCISWSNAPILPSPWGARPHDSLLAIGSRSGTLAFWQYNAHRQWTKVWSRVVADQWITHATWSEWVTTGTDALESTNKLAFACTDGSVYTIQVQLQFAEDGHHSSVNVGQPVMRIPPHASAITGLQFARDNLVCTRTGLVQVVTPEKSTLEEIRLSKIGNWPSCSRYSPCNGIGALSEECILISLYSGEHHVIRTRNGRPVIDSAASQRLTDGLRGNIEGADISIDEAIARKSPRITGFTLAPAMIGDGGSTLFACVLERCLANGFVSAATGPTRDSAVAYYVSPVKYKYRGEQTGQENVTTKEVALANLRYCWNDSRQAKICQLVNVWRMWNEHSTSTPFDHANQSSAQDIILAPALAYMIAVNGLEGTGDPAINLDVICRMLQLKAASTPSDEIQSCKRQLIETLPRKTDLAARTNDVCLICSESIPFDVQVEQDPAGLTSLS
ncbi:hypothetical protein QFC20_004223 [Naganishia adeliensis]|uniref:Uncharacterized protein n=1 Tax=Naganishia adeliensis TaxID=92952 RepID=A0ACC2W3B9_9TREE|nr:hypothetical protein QFC20_004223 [Naganishia adeliensis]